MFYNKLLNFYLLNLFFIKLCVGITPEVKTSSGVVSGNTVRVLNTDIHQYFNIPFAESPLGALRFTKPIALKNPIKGVIDGTKWSGRACDTEEDCLVLNVFTPAVNQTNAPLMAVMFYIFGGGFHKGSPVQMDGSALAAQGVVYVSPNYRLGLFGFLYGGEESAPGNMGLYDQTLALKWVRENIHMFGGNKDKITIFGNSAGSFCVSTHVLSPLSNGLFRRAILQSGALLEYNKKEYNTTQRLDESKQTAKSLNCSGDQWLDCLRNVDADLLRKINQTMTNFPVLGTEFLPIIAQDAFKNGKYAQDIDLMVGNTQNDAGGTFHSRIIPNKIPNYEINFKNDFEELFPGNDPNPAFEFYFSTADKTNPDSLFSAYYNFISDVNVICTTYAFAKLFATNTPKRNTFYYQLTYSGIPAFQPDCNATTIPYMGVCHATELIYVFDDPLMKPIDRPADRLQLEFDFSIEVMKMWTQFAKTGKPTEDSHKWPQLLSNPQSPKTKELNAFSYYRVYDDLYHYTCDGLYKNLLFDDKSNISAGLDKLYLCCLNIIVVLVSYLI